MKKLLFAGVLLLAVLVPVSLLGAQEVVDSFLPPGCDSFTGFSATTGEPCKTKTTPTNLPPGCTSNVGYSATTGEPCKVPTTPTNLPPGCTSTSGYSATTGEPCKVPTTPTNLPPACTSTSGYSATTGEPCGTTTTISPPTIPTTPTTFPTTPTTIPTTDSQINFTRNLTIGSRGTDVTELQELLRGQGLLNAEPTGYFGTLTKEAVQKFQRARGISDTGYVGTLTRGALTNLNLANSSDDTFLPPSGDPRVPTTNPSNPVTTQQTVSVDIKANSSDGPIIVASGTPVGLSWTSGNADFCIGYSPTNVAWIGEKILRSYFYDIGSMTADTTFTLICTKGNETSSDSVMVNIGTPTPPPPPPPPPTAPATPTGLIVTPSSTQVNLNWNAVTGATAYRVYRGTNATDLALVISPDTTGTTQTGLVAGTTYYYAVSAFNASGESAKSAVVSATVPNTPTTLFEPTGLTATPATDRINLSWNAVAGATGYKLYRGTSGRVSDLSLLDSPSGTSFTNTSVVAGTTYYYSVSAYNPSGDSFRSAIVSTTFTGTPPPPPTAPAAPTNVRATAVSPTQVNVTWNTVSGATHYTIGRSTGTTVTSTTYLGRIETNSYTDTNASPNTSYSYAVSSWTNTLYSATGGRSTVVTTPAITTSAPTATLTANPTSITAGQSSMLTWTSSNATSCDTSYIPGGRAGAATSDSTGLRVTPTVTTTYEVFCTNSAGQSTRGGVTVNITTTPIPPPGDVACVINSMTASPSTVLSGGSSTVSWNTSGCDSVYIGILGYPKETVIAIGSRAYASITSQKNIELQVRKRVTSGPNEGMVNDTFRMVTINVGSVQVGNVLSALDNRAVAQNTAPSPTAVSTNVACPELSQGLGFKSWDKNIGGVDVTALQSFLASQNLLNVSPTGYFGPLTLRAVQSFQRGNGLIADGYVGPATRAKIKEVACR